MLLHVIWSLVNPFEIACDDLVNLHAVFKDFRLPIVIFPFDFRDNWVVPLNSEDLVGDLVELFHFSLPQQLAEILEVLCLLKGTGNRKFLLLFFDLVAIVVPNGDMSPIFLLLLGPKSKGFSD
jgi:hypothetical protein